MVHTYYIGRIHVERKYQLQLFTPWHIERVGFEKNANIADIACRTANRRLPWQ